MKKKLLVTVLMATMVLSMAACSGTEDVEHSSVSVNESQTQESSDEEKEEVPVIEEGIFAYGGNKADNFNAVAYLPEGGYVAVGDTLSWDIEGVERYGGDTDAVIATFDTTNNVVWNVSYGGEEADTYKDVAVTADGEYIAVGYKMIGGRDYSAIIVKYDADGNIVWEKEYGSYRQNAFNSVVCIPDGGVIVAGYVQDGNVGGLTIKGSLDGIIVKYDADGNIVWQYNYGGSYNDKFNEIKLLDDGSFIVAGQSYSVDVEGLTNLGSIDDSTSDAILVKYDENGNILWQRNYGGNDSDGFDSVAVTTGGDIIAVGHAYSTDMEGVTVNEGGYVGYIAYMDSEGNIKWQKGYGATGWNTFQSVVVSDQNEIYVTGHAMSIDGYEATTARNAIVLKYDEQGNIVEQTPYLGGIENLPEEIILTNSGYIVVGNCTIGMEGLDTSFGSTDALRIVHNN